MRVAIVLLVLLAGCSTTDVQVQPDPTPTEVVEAPAVPAWGFQDCLEVAGISVYPRDEYARTAGPPAPFVPADIREDVGDAVIASANGAGWLAATDEVAGHWHAAVHCGSMRFNGTTAGAIDWGWVGVRVEPPPFDDSDVTRHYLLAVHSWPEPLQQALATWGHATRTEQAAASLDGVASMLLDDAEHGRYEGTAPVEPAGSRDAETIRFWLLLPASGHHNHHDQEGPYTPVAFDLVDTPKQILRSPETIGAFAHTQTDHHAPLPGLGGNAAMSAWTEFDRTLRPGPRPAITLNETWVH